MSYLCRPPNPLCLNRVINISSCRKLNSGKNSNMQICRFLGRMAISGKGAGWLICILRIQNETLGSPGQAQRNDFSFPQKGGKKDLTQTRGEGPCATCSVSVKGEALIFKTPGHVCKSWLLHFSPLSMICRKFFLPHFWRHDWAACHPCLLMLMLIFNPSSKVYVKGYPILSGQPQQELPGHKCWQFLELTCSWINLHTLDFFSNSWKTRVDFFF